MPQLDNESHQSYQVGLIIGDDMLFSFRNRVYLSVSTILLFRVSILYSKRACIRDDKDTQIYYTSQYIYVGKSNFNLSLNLPISVHCTKPNDGHKTKQQ